MKILFDHQIFSLIYGGASKYFAMLMDNLPRGTWDCTARFSSNEYVRDKQLLSPTCKKYFRGQNVLQERLNRPYTNWKIGRGQFDVFHQTNFGTYCLNALGNRPMVTTYHDSNLSTIDPHPEIVERQRVSLNRADAIITVSKNTRADLLRLFPIDESKVHVIYHGIERTDLSRLPKERIIQSPYILYVGRRSKFKNYENFVRACSMVVASHPELQIVCTAAHFSEQEQALHHKLGIAGNIQSVMADEPTMERLYRDALAFVFPSFYEGFGMPILEAWNCGCPVLLSDASCFPEIAGDAGLYFNPSSADDMTSKILSVIESPTLRQSLITRAALRLPLFSWQKCADEHMQVYSSLI
jgi:glycosyltransferase, family 1